MTVEQAIKIDNNWKELTKKMIDNCRNFNDFTKELLKLSAELQHEQNKSAILAKYQMMQSTEHQSTKNKDITKEGKKVLETNQ